MNFVQTLYEKKVVQRILTSQYFLKLMLLATSGVWFHEEFPEWG